MATKDDRPNLLSKVAMFVRNPTKDWSELDRAEPEQEAGYDKQALKAMIERKRQNDFVRKREFDQLRKLRTRGAAELGAMARPSLFQSSLATDPDGRAVTLKKIDEIEAQMSKQWWKGKQESAAAGPRGDFPVAKPTEDAVPPEAMDAPTRAPDSGFEPTATVDLNSKLRHQNTDDFEATEMGVGLSHTAQIKSMPPVRGTGVAAPLVADTDLGKSGPAGFSTSELFAIDLDELDTDPELEEAAIRFANGDDSGAEVGLLEALRGPANQLEVALSWVAALLDLYRATGNQEKFDSAVMEFAPRFERLSPVWFTIGGATSGAVDTPAGTAAGKTLVATQGASGAIWDSPVELTGKAMEALRDAMSSQPPPWHIDWSRLNRIEADAMPLLEGLFESLCAEEVSLRFSGSDQLVQALRMLMPSGDRTVGTRWWGVRLNALRSMHLQDDFELAALDYCVTFEVAPPAWQEPRCLFESVESLETAVAGASPGAVGVGQRSTANALTGSEGTPALATELRGQVLGDATQALAGLDSAGYTGNRITVSCAGLVRVDFSAAGSILNWVATRQSEGCVVQFRDVHRLVAAFFNVIGINEHAKVVPRPI